MVKIDDPTVLEVKETMADFSDEIDRAEFRTGESSTGNKEYRVEIGNSLMRLVEEGDDGMIKLKAEGDKEVRNVSDLDYIEFNPRNKRVYLPEIDFGL